MRVPAISIGTAALAMPYGIGRGSSRVNPGADAVAEILRAAADAGIRLFDTAPSYGASEDLVGEGLANRARVYISTKVHVPSALPQDRDFGAVVDAVERSISRSLWRLRRSSLDLVQIHNATAPVIADGRILDALEAERERGRLRSIGATVYEPEDALAAIQSGRIDTLQIPFSILDQRARSSVLPAARSRSVGLIARSVLLQGALSPRALELPNSLAPLRSAIERIRSTLDDSWTALPEIAIRYCFGVPELDTILIGVRSMDELELAVRAVRLGPLSPDTQRSLDALGLTEPRWIDPRHWPSLKES